MSKRLLGLLVILVLALAGCLEGEPEIAEEEQLPAEQREAAAAADNGDGEPGEDVEIADSATFVAVDNEFTEAPSEVSAGAVEFTLENEGVADHNVVITEPSEITLVDTIPGGETATNVVELEPGDYEYICDIPGHAATMNGTLTVTE